MNRLIGEIPTLYTRHEAYETVDKNKRYKQIIEILSSGKELSAKEIAVEMYNRGYTPTTERNFAAPRLTELSYQGIVEPCGKRKCQYTGKTTAIYKLLSGDLNG